MTAVLKEDFWEDARATRLRTAHTAGAVSFTVTAGGLSTWTPVVSGRFSVIVDRGTAQEEHLYGAAIAGDQITGITRVSGASGTAFNHGVNATVEHGLLAKHIDVSNEFLSSPTAAGQVAVSAGADEWGSPSATLDGLNLTNPTLTSPNIGGTEFGDAQHVHSGPSQGGVLGGGTPTTSAVADAATTGTAGAYATANHRHGREGFGNPVASAPGDTTAGGTAGTVAHSDHRHARELFAGGPTTLPGVGVSGTAGAASTVARGDHTHTVPAGGTPGTSSSGDIADAGTATTVARSDHRHGREYVVKPATLSSTEDVVHGVTAWSLSAAASVNVVVTWPSGFIYAATPTILALPLQGAAVRVAVEMIAASDSGATFLVYRPDGTSVTASGSLHWMAIGV